MSYEQMNAALDFYWSNIDLEQFTDKQVFARSKFFEAGYKAHADSVWKDLEKFPHAEFVIVGYFNNNLEYHGEPSHGGYVTVAWYNSDGEENWQNANGDILKTPDKWMPYPMPPRGPNLILPPPL